MNVVCSAAWELQRCISMVFVCWSLMPERFQTSSCCTEVRLWDAAVALTSGERKKLILVQNENKPQQAAVESRAGNGSG